jgi:hypothetical protein
MTKGSGLRQYGLQSLCQYRRRSLSPAHRSRPELWARCSSRSTINRLRLCRLCTPWSGQSFGSGLRMSRRRASFRQIVTRKCHSTVTCATRAIRMSAHRPAERPEWTTPSAVGRWVCTIQSMRTHHGICDGEWPSDCHCHPLSSESEYAAVHCGRHAPEDLPKG